MNSMKTPGNEWSRALHLSSGKSVSCDCIKASSCIELADIRKLDSLLNQCESISCDNLLLCDEIYNYDLCSASKRKYVSTSALHKILPKNSIRRRAHKKVLGIREHDSKIIKLIDDKHKRHKESEEDVAAAGELTKCCELNNDKCVVVDGDDDDEDELLRTRSCTNLLQHPETATATAPSAINCCDKTIQTSYSELYGRSDDVVCKYLSTDGTCNNQMQPTQQDKRKKAKRKQCSCRDYENVNFICETSLTTIPNITMEATPTKASSVLSVNKNPKKSLLQVKKDKSEERQSKSHRFMKQKNSIVDDDECGGASGGNNSDGCHDRVTNINEKSAEIFPISLNSSYSQSATPRGTTNNLHHDSKSDRSETPSQKSKRSKFSPSFISRKLTSRLNSEDDGAGGVKESLLGRSSKSADKKLPEPVETVCIDDIISRSFLSSFELMSFPIFLSLSFFSSSVRFYCPCGSILKIVERETKGGQNST